MSRLATRVALRDARVSRVGDLASQPLGDMQRLVAELYAARAIRLHERHKLETAVDCVREQAERAHATARAVTSSPGSKPSSKEGSDVLVVWRPGNNNAAGSVLAVVQGINEAAAVAAGAGAGADALPRERAAAGGGGLSEVLHHEEPVGDLLWALNIDISTDGGGGGGGDDASLNMLDTLEVALKRRMIVLGDRGPW
jgi:hypothetical protein